MEKRPYVIAIDGRAAAGKTTLAEAIARKMNACVIHMDDFFLPAQLRTEHRYAMPGGNVHYERFIEEVLNPLRTGNSISYRKYSCKKMDYEPERVLVSGCENIIVEGAYSLHPAFDNYYDVSLFLDIEKEEQKRRIVARAGEKALEMFVNKWIPLEENYLQTCEISKKCNYYILAQNESV